MAKSRKPYPREFWEDAVRLYRSSGKSLATISRELGIGAFSAVAWELWFTGWPVPMSVVRGYLGGLARIEPHVDEARWRWLH